MDSDQPNAAAPGSPFKFKLGQRVAITISGEDGEVVGRAEYTNSEPHYYVRYKDASGHARTVLLGSP